MLFWLGISSGWLRVGGTIIYMLRKHFTGQGQGTDIFLFHFLLMALSTSSKAESISISQIQKQSSWSPVLPAPYSNLNQQYFNTFY